MNKSSQYFGVLVFLIMLVMFQVWIEHTFIIGFITDFQIVNIDIQPKKFWSGIRAQCFFFVMLILVDFFREKFNEE